MTSQTQDEAEILIDYLEKIYELARPEKGKKIERGTIAKVAMEALVKVGAREAPREAGDADRSHSPS